MSLFHYPSNTKLPHTDYRFSVQYQLSEEDRPLNCSEVIIELCIRQRYALILEPIKGQRVSLEDDYVVSPEFVVQFKIPLWLLVGNGPDLLRWRDHCVSARLSSLPINAGLAQFLKPHIQRRAVYLAYKTGHRREVKLVFHVTVSKIDLADVEECARIRRSWSSSTVGSESRPSEDLE